MANQHCLNCGARLEGPYCHACGQPVKGMIRHFKSILADVLDTVFEYDGRIWRTLVPLYFVPGKVTRDFIAGRRNRYVTPFRLAFVSSVVAFLILQLVVTADGPAIEQAANFRGIAEADTVEAVAASRARALEALDEAGAGLPQDGAVTERLAVARRAVEAEAQQRIDWLEAAEAARQRGDPPPPEPASGARLYLGDEAIAWDPRTNPVVIGWLPDAANQQINAWIVQGLENVQRFQEDPGRFVDGFLGMLPAVLFVLMPIFALLLKIFYVGTGRLYMEHMVVTLHSQSFLVLGLTVHVLLEALAEWLPAGFGVKAASSFLAGLALAWLPVYILFMQRQVYRQSWAVTFAKYLIIGGIYGMLVIAGVVVALLVTLVRG